MGSDSSILAWRIPWTEEPGELLSWQATVQRAAKSQTCELLSKGLQRVRHDWSDLACTHVLPFTDSLFYNFPTDKLTGMNLGSCCKNMWGLMPGVPKILWEPSELSAWIEGSELKPCLQRQMDLPSGCEGAGLQLTNGITHCSVSLLCQV